MLSRRCGLIAGGGFQCVKRKGRGLVLEDDVHVSFSRYGLAWVKKKERNAQGYYYEDKLLPLNPHSFRDKRVLIRCVSYRFDYPWTPLFDISGSPFSRLIGSRTGRAVAL